jgi:NAD(P)-dependent dehydrogenase (short-subunit alcohol dehydrogenase family)
MNVGILDGKAVVVTGAGRGIGRGHATVLAAQGAAVVVNDVDLAEAQSAMQEIVQAGGRAAANGSDIGTRKGCEELVAQCVSEFGKIDGVVNNAGIVRDRSFLKMSDQEFDDVFRIHAKSTFWCSQEAARHMVERGTGGCILSTTSGALMGNFGQTNYAAAKGAIMSMTLTWAIELARYGIRANSLAPSGTTRMTSAARAADGSKIELPYWDPALNGHIAAYLISDKGSWVTGQVVACGMDRLGIMRQPSYDKLLMREQGWTLDAVERYFEKSFRGQLEPFGLSKTPYAFYDGVKPPAK